MLSFQFFHCYTFVSISSFPHSLCFTLSLSWDWKTFIFVSQRTMMTKGTLDGEIFQHEKLFLTTISKKIFCDFNNYNILIHMMWIRRRFWSQRGIKHICSSRLCGGTILNMFHDLWTSRTWRMFKLNLGKFQFINSKIRTWLSLKFINCRNDKQRHQDNLFACK